jgi:hypothetical protein
MNGTKQRFFDVTTGQRASGAIQREEGRVMAKGMRRGQLLLTMMLGLLLAACGGEGGNEFAPVTVTPAVATLSGIAATGAAVQGVVTLKDVPSGQLQATHTDDGSYTFNVTGLAGPFLLRVVSDDRATVLYSVALKTGTATRAHLNPLSHRLMAFLSEQPAVLGDARTLAQVFNDMPGPFAGLDSWTLSYARYQMLQQTSPYFRQRLQAHGVDFESFDPVAGPYAIGQGLDLAFDEVQFFYDDRSGEAWEKSVASGALVGAAMFPGSLGSPWSFSVDADAEYLVPGSSQAVTATGRWPVWLATRLRHGVRWAVSDASLASIDENGVVTAKAFTGTHSLTVTGYYPYGDWVLEDSVTFTLVEQTPVESVDMSEMPDTLAGNDTHVLFTTVQLTDAAGGGTVQQRSGSWSLVDPDPPTAAAVSFNNEWGYPTLSIGPLLQDTSVRLRAVQTIGGQQYTTEKVVTLKKHVRLPVGFVLSCPSALNYGVATTCPARIVYDDYTDQEVMVPLSVDAADAAHVTVAGSTLTSNWGDTDSWHHIDVSASHEGMTAVQRVTLNQRRLQVTALEIVGVGEMPENASTSLQAWATWDDGSRSDVSSTVAWTSSDTAAVDFAQYSYGNARSYYLLDQPGDRALTITATICPDPSYGCAANQRLAAAHPLTVRYASLALVGLDLGTGVTGYGFAAQGQVHTLTARAIWNKKLRDYTPYTTAIASGVEWSSNNAAAVVSGSTLTVGSIGSEHLALLTARYRDPNDAGVVRTARRVVALHSTSGTSRTLSLTRVNWGTGSTYLLGGDGLARPLGYFSPLPGRRVGVPDPFITGVKQVVHTEHGQAYLRDDGTVWYPEPINTLSLSQEMRDQLVRQSYGSVLPRPIPGVSNVVMLASTADYWFQGQLYALRADGTVLRIKINPTPGGSARSYGVSSAHSGVSRITSGSMLLMVMQDGTVQRRTDSNHNGTESLKKADNSLLTGIADVSAFSSGGMALAGDGTLWTWGSNSNGELGLGDNVTRTHASPISSVTGFSQLAGMMPAALRGDGTLWSWGLNSQAASTLPKQVNGFSDVTAITAGYAVAADGKVWWWGRDPGGYDLSAALPVFAEGSADTQLTLP